MNGLHFAVNVSMLFQEVPFLDRFHEAARAGFRAVEFLFPYEVGVERIAAQAADAGLSVVLFDAPPGARERGELGVLGMPDRRTYFRESIHIALAAATRLGCARVNVLFGNRQPGVEPAVQMDCAAENLAWAAPLAREAGVTLLVEALNPTDFPDFFLVSGAAACELVRAVGHPNVRLQFDVYHAQMSAGNLVATITRYFDDIGHIQIADVPGRHEPGTGEIHYPVVFAHLEALGYTGYIGLEYEPSGSTVESLGWLPRVQRRG